MIRRVAIVGAGTMGTGIAITCLAAGLPTTLIDTANTALGRAKDRIYGYFVREVDKGRMTPGQKERLPRPLCDVVSGARHGRR